MTSDPISNLVHWYEELSLRSVYGRFEMQGLRLLDGRNDLGLYAQAAASKLTDDCWLDRDQDLRCRLSVRDFGLDIGLTSGEAHYLGRFLAVRVVNRERLLDQYLDYWTTQMSNAAHGKPYGSRALEDALAPVAETVRAVIPADQWYDLVVDFFEESDEAGVAGMTFVNLIRWEAIENLWKQLVDQAPPETRLSR